MKINETLVKVDIALDYVPVLSTVSNLVDLFQKSVIIPLLDKSSLKNRYFRHLNEKSFIKCFFYMIPFSGIILKLYHSLRPSSEIEKIQPAASHSARQPTKAEDHQDTQTQSVTKPLHDISKTSKPRETLTEQEQIALKEQRKIQVAEELLATERAIENTFNESDPEDKDQAIFAMAESYRKLRVRAIMHDIQELQEKYTKRAQEEYQKLVAKYPIQAIRGLQSLVDYDD